MLVEQSDIYNQNENKLPEFQICFILNNFSSLFFSLNNISYSQILKSNNELDNQNFRPIKIEAFWLDLCNPSELFTLINKSENNRGRLEVKVKNLLTFGLKNTNQFKYDYKINSIPFASFVDTSYSNFANVVKSKIELITDPFFKFQVNAESPRKLRHKQILSLIDSIDRELNIRWEKLSDAMLNYNFNNVDNPPLVLKNNEKEYTDYKKIYNEYRSTYYKYTEILESLNNILSVKNEKNLLLINIEKLIDTEKIQLDKYTKTHLEELKNDINTMSESEVEFSRNSSDLDSLKAFKEHLLASQYKVLNAYQQISQSIKRSFIRLEVQYDSIKNELLGRECKRLSKQEEVSFDLIVKNFQHIKEILHDIQFLYIQSPLENHI